VSAATRGERARRRERVRAPSLGPLLAGHEVVLVCGPGGVGKTSMAAAAGVAAVRSEASRVLVLTVDPARRLADALGLDGIGDRATRVPPALLDAAGVDARGELWVAMLDTQASWDALVRRHAPDDATRDRILGNPLYRTITTRFVHSHDYVAMERLHELHTSGEWDLVIVDTPPSRHAIDLLDAPGRMVEFFGGRMVRLLTAPYRAGRGRGARFVDLAARPFYQVADRLLGSQFLEDIAELFMALSALSAGFVERAAAVERLLGEPRTTFLVVGVAEEEPLREVAALLAELDRRELPRGAVVLNRVMPAWAHDAAARRAAARLAADPQPAAAAVAAALGADAVDADAVDAVAAARVLAAAADAFRDLEAVAVREATLVADALRGPGGAGVPVVRVPHLAGDIHDLAGLAEAAGHLTGRDA
jgi:anion-transporting  ArsA/GET3 family ATPase